MYTLRKLYVNSTVTFTPVLKQSKARKFCPRLKQKCFAMFQPSDDSFFGRGQAWDTHLLYPMDHVRALKDSPPHPPQPLTHTPLTVALSVMHLKWQHNITLISVDFCMFHQKRKDKNHYPHSIKNGEHLKIKINYYYYIFCSIYIICDEINCFNTPTSLLFTIYSPFQSISF